MPRDLQDIPEESLTPQKLVSSHIEYLDSLEKLGITLNFGLLPKPKGHS